MDRGMIRLLFSSLIFLAALWGYQFLYRFGAAGFILPADEIGWLKHLRGVLLILAGSIGLPLAAEWISFGLSNWLEKDPLKVRSFSLAWVRGVVLYLVVAFLCAGVLIYAGRTEKPWAPLAAGAGLMTALLILRRPFQWMVTGGLVGKISNAPGRFIGSMMAMVWNLMGFWLASLHEQASFFSAGGIVLVGFGFVIPVAVGYILFRLLEMWLSKSDSPMAHWNVSGSILYLSWFCFGFIARLAPTTLGRPERWVGLPREGSSN